MKITCFRERNKLFPSACPAGFKRSSTASGIAVVLKLNISSTALGDAVLLRFLINADALSREKPQGVP